MGQDAVQPTAKRDTWSQTGKESSKALISLSVAKSRMVSTSWAQKGECMGLGGQQWGQQGAFPELSGPTPGIPKMEANFQSLITTIPQSHMPTHSYGNTYVGLDTVGCMFGVVCVCRVCVICMRCVWCVQELGSVPIWGGGTFSRPGGGE